MEFFLKYGNEIYVPVGKYGNKKEAIQELLNPLYGKIIRSRMNNGRMFLVKRKKTKNKGDRIKLSSIELIISEKEGELSITTEGKFSAC